MSQFTSKFKVYDHSVIKKIFLVLVITSLFQVSPSYAKVNYESAGSGDQVVTLNSFKSPKLITITNQGSSNFIVKAYTSKGNSLDLIVNEIGNYQGTHIVRASKTSDLKVLEVQSDGNWAIKVSDLIDATNWNGKLVSGSFSTVFEIKKPFGSLSKLKMQHQGDSNFIVITFDKNGKRLSLKANEIANYNGTKILGSNVSFITIETQGNWSIEKLK